MTVSAKKLSCLAIYKQQIIFRYLFPLMKTEWKMESKLFSSVLCQLIKEHILLPSHVPLSGGFLSNHEFTGAAHSVGCGDSATVAFQP